MEQARRELPDIEYCDDPYACVRGADAMVVVTGMGAIPHAWIWNA